MPDPDHTIAPARGTLIHLCVTMCGMGQLLLIRHGETVWSRTGQYGGRTDLPLTAGGAAAGRALGPLPAGRPLAAAFSSPLSRAALTAELAGLTDVKPDPDLLEWDYGDYEGMTEEQIRQTRPGWDLWRDGVAGGETLNQVAARTDAVLDRVRPLLRDGDVAIIGHGHLQRVLAVRWLGLDPSAGRMLSHPSTGTLSSLDYEHEEPVVSAWNILP
jgi:broad specificity phosphatase PhoE